jgi:hypothetical protein
MDTSYLGELIADMVRMLTPIHEAEAAAVKGGPACAKMIARLYEMAIEAEPLARKLDAAVEFLEGEIEDLKEEKGAEA